jgi:ATP-binding cassette subfamily B protein
LYSEVEHFRQANKLVNSIFNQKPKSDMSYIQGYLQDFLKSIQGFEHLPTEAITYLAEQIQALRYCLGQKILTKERMTNKVAIVYEGTARLLGYAPHTNTPTTLKLLEPRASIGEISLLRQLPCETVIASTELTCLTIDAADFFHLFDKYPAFAEARKNSCHLVEVFDILSLQLEKQAQGNINLKELAQDALIKAKVYYLSPGKTTPKQLENDSVWFVSGGGTVTNLSVGDRIELNNPQNQLIVKGKIPVRLIGLSPSALMLQDSHDIESQINNKQTFNNGKNELEISYASDESLGAKPYKTSKKISKYPFFSGKGQLNSANACFQMISKYLEMPSRRELVRRILTDQMKRQGSISFQFCAYLAESIGLKAQLVDIPLFAVSRIPTPAIIRYSNEYTVVYEASEHAIALGIPSQGIQHHKPTEFIARLEDAQKSSHPPQIRALIISTTRSTPRQRFGIQWFFPYLKQYRRVLIEVFIASFVVQLASLGNPLVIQLIIDKVITQNSIGTLHILGVLLLVLGLFEVVLNTLRTYLFVDTTNRIDMGLGSEIIDHLLRLPLPYFERRSVGELSTRINELENIRQFLTGTALTVGLDALFSVVYVIVMLFYSWQLTLIGLGMIPVFIVISLVASPMVSRQLRTKAERNAETQSYLVETMSGIQTVKAQNIELQSRFSWQERYARYVAASFKTVVTSTLATSTSNFLNKLTGLLVLWVGAYLVLNGELTLGELIAFRIRDFQKIKYAMGNNDNHFKGGE